MRASPELSTWAALMAEAAPELLRHAAQHSVKPALLLFYLKDRKEQLCDCIALHAVDKLTLTGVPALQIHSAPCQPEHL